MYEGSMIGAGVHVFAVWNYVIAKTRRGVIELNPKMLAFILGGTMAEVEDAIKILCAPDAQSRSKNENGRRLVREGEFQYRVVNWEKYNGIKTETDRREYNRVKQQEYRAKKKPGSGPSAVERREIKEVEDGIRSMEELGNGLPARNGLETEPSDIRTELTRGGV